MEPPTGFLATLWSFIKFLPFFCGLLVLGFVKGIILCPVICLVIAIGNSAIILGLWPAHSIWTYYCIVSSKQLGPVLKIVLFLCTTVFLILWPLFGIVASIVGGAAYGLLGPMFSTFNAVGEGKTSQFYHTLYDGTWSTIKGSFVVVTDFKDVCFHSYFSLMDDLRCQIPSNGNVYEIRLLHLPGAVVAAVLGILTDLPIISLLALYKTPYMLFKGWHRLFHDLVGREGPFLETICVPFAGLAILLWPLAVVGALLGSIVSSMLLGAYAGVVAYQEHSFWFGLCYIVASLSLYDEYSNDVLDMPEGSCFPRPRFRKRTALNAAGSRTCSFSRPNSFQNPPSRALSLKGSMIELTPFELFDDIFKACSCNGETMVTEGVIMLEDIEGSKSGKGEDDIISIGLPAYCLLRMLLRSANANSDGLLLSDGVTEITSTNRPKDVFFDWFLNPLLIIKAQIRAVNLSDGEEDYLGGLVLSGSNLNRLKNYSIGFPPESDVKQAELQALARRLRGIMKSISRYPTFRRRFDCLVKALSERLAGRNNLEKIPRPKSGFVRIFSQDSFRGRRGDGIQQFGNVEINTV